MNEEEEFFAWLDGELHGEQAERVAARVAASPELTARAERHRRLAAGLRDAFEPVMEAETTPPRLQAGKVVEFGSRRTALRAGWLAIPQWAAMAATLAIGLVAGVLVGGHGETDSPVAAADGQLIAASGLDEALDTRLASMPAADGPRIGLTYRDSTGRVCRTFTDASASGLACREGDSWRIRGLFQGAEGQGGDYRMAAGEDPRLAALVDETIAGDPFDAGQERTARDKGWR